MDDVGTGGHQDPACDQRPIDVLIPPGNLPAGEHGRAVSRKYSGVIFFFFSMFFGVLAVQMLAEGDLGEFTLVALIAIGMFAFGRTLWNHADQSSPKPDRAKAPSQRGRKRK